MPQHQMWYTFLNKDVQNYSLVRRLGPKEGVSYLGVKIRSWNPHTVLFWVGKALAYHITGLFNTQEGFFRIDVGLFRIGDSLL